MQRIKQTRSRRYLKLSNHHRKKNGVIYWEEELRNCKRKTSNFEEFILYAKTKIRVLYRVKDTYYHKMFRKFRLNSYINTQKSEANMVKLMETKFKPSKYGILIRLLFIIIVIIRRYWS